MSRQLKGKKYDALALTRAVDAVKGKSMGYLKASRVYNVPRSTIYDKVKEKSEISARQGPNTVLSSEEEERLAKWLVEMSRIGYGRSKQELLETVKMIIKADGRKNPFKDDKPGKDWYYSFMKRHPEISLRSPRQLGKERAVIRANSVEKWFGDFEEYIIEATGSRDILQDPSRMYNADESGFSLCPNTGRVFGLRGAKSVYNLTASDKSQITVLAGMSASAHYQRPMIVFPGQHFSKNMLEGFDNAVMGRSDNGWMDSELFVEWLKTVFIPDITERKVKRPVILLVDGHKTHLTQEASDTCLQNDIILYCLLEHASHLMQPCDLQLFGTLKETWKTSLRQWQIEHVGQYVTKYEFAAIFKSAWVNASRVDVAVKGFKDSGLFPLNRHAVLKTDKLQTSKLFEPVVDKGASKTDSNVCNSSESKAHEDVPDKTREDVQDKTHEDVQDKTHENVNVEKIPQTEKTNQENNKDGDTQKDVETPLHTEIAATQVNSQTCALETANDTVNEPVASTSKYSGQENLSPLSKILSIPQPKTSSRRSVKRELIPKAVTGVGFRSILAERKRKREAEEHAKEQRKVIRIQKREEREKIKKEKAEMRQERKKKAEQNKKEKDIMKKLKELQKKKKTNDDSDDGDSDFSVHDESDDEVGADPNKCYKCDGADNNTGWIGCQKCFKFFHRGCTDIDFESLTEEEIEGYPFECLYC